MTGTEANNRLREEGVFRNDTRLSIEEAMEVLTGDRFDFRELFNGGTEVTAELLGAMEQSALPFLAHVRLNSTKSGESHHSTMMSGFRTDENGELIIELMNPYRLDSDHGSNRTEVRLDEIDRFDFFVAVPNLENPQFDFETLLDIR